MSNDDCPPWTVSCPGKHTALSPGVPTFSKMSTARSCLPLNSEPRLRPQRSAVEVEKEHAKDAQRAASREHSDTSTDTQVQIERPSEHYGAAGECGATEVVGGEERSSVLRVRDWDVDEYALEALIRVSVALLSK